MAAPGMLQNPSVRTWLGDVVPAWSLLDQAGFSALRHPPHPRNGPIRLATDLSPEEIGLSAIARNALTLLHAAEIAPGLKLTATGNLSRKVVAEMLDLFAWPDLDKADMLSFNKVVNEPDFLPLFLVRHLLNAAGLVKRQKGRLKLTSPGRQTLQSPGRDALQAMLFHIAFWGMDLSYLGRGPIEGWPQRDIGIVLWSLSVAANQWQSSARLTRLCTIPVNGVIESQWDVGTYAMEATVLRPLMFFGLLEHRAEDIPGQSFAKRHFYRKTSLFDRFLSFDVTLETDGMARH
jgi:hypothetical protein